MPRYDTYATPRADLGQALWEYAISPDAYIGTQALALTPVPRKAATFSKASRASILRDRTVVRAAGAAYNRDKLQYTDDSYACLEYGYEEILDDGERANFASDFDAEADSSMNALHVILREQERRIAAALFNTSTWTGATLFTDVSVVWATTTADVMTDVLAAKEKVRTLTGMMPDTMILNHTNFNYLKNNDDMIGRVVYTQTADDATMANALAKIFGLKRILVGDAVRNSAIEGAAFASANVWSSSYVMLAVTAPAGPLTRQPCVGRTFVWTGDGAGNVQVEQYRDESRRSDVFRVRQHTDEEVIDASYAHLLKVD